MLFDLLGQPFDFLIETWSVQELSALFDPRTIVARNSQDSTTSRPLYD
jgi:hypothetical protein